MDLEELVSVMRDAWLDGDTKAQGELGAVLATRIGAAEALPGRRLTDVGHRIGSG